MDTTGFVTSRTMVRWGHNRFRVEGYASAAETRTRIKEKQARGECLSLVKGTVVTLHYGGWNSISGGRNDSTSFIF